MQYELERSLLTANYQEVIMLRKNNRLNNEMIYQSLSKELNRVPTLDEFIEAGIKESKRAQALDLIAGERVNQQIGQSIADFDWNLFEKVQRERLERTYYSRIKELEIARVINDAIQELGNQNDIKEVYYNHYLDTLAGIDLIARVGNQVAYIHVTRQDADVITRLIHETEQQSIKETKRLPIKELSRPYEVLGWCEIDRDYSNHLWAYYEQGDEAISKQDKEEIQSKIIRDYRDGKFELLNKSSQLAKHIKAINGAYRVIDGLESVGNTDISLVA